MIKRFFLFIFIFSFSISLSLASLDAGEGGDGRVSGEGRASSRASKRKSPEPDEKCYAIATTDTAFKQLLAPEPGNYEVLRSFLQTFVPSFHADPVIEIHAMPVAIPVLRDRGERERQKFMDLHVRTEHARYIIEMQARRHERFDERALFYACDTYSKQLPEARLRGRAWYQELRPVIAIHVLDYDSNRTQGVAVDALADRVAGHPLPEEQYLKHYKLTDLHSGQVIDHLQMIQIELPRGEEVLRRKPDPKTFVDSDWWLDLLCHSQDYTQERLRDLATKGVVVPDFFTRGLERLNKTIWRPEVTEAYAADLTDREAFATVLAVERKEGHTAGIKEGLLQAARAMKIRRISNADIARDLGLPEADVAAIETDEAAS